METASNRPLTIFLMIIWLAAAGVLTPVKTSADDDFTRYNDTFESLREDNWDRAQLTFNDEQLDNFKLGDLDIVDNRLRISTKTGGFSKAGLSSRYSIRGDFDVQIDCQVKFNRSMSGMDHFVNFVALTRAENFNASQKATVSLVYRSGQRGPAIAFMHIQNQKKVKRKHQKISNFNGVLRLVREGQKMTGYYQPEGSSRWRTLGSSSSFATEDVMVGFVLQNLASQRKKIKAASPVEVYFDNFRINQAGEVIEDEI